MRLTSVVLFFAALCSAAPPKVTVLEAARLFDGKSNRVESPGIVVVEDGKITGVGPDARIPAGAETIDLGDATLLPGFIDAHTHLSMMYSDDWKQSFIDGFRKPVPELALDATENLRVTLLAGFTTVRDVGST
ncbi:MAG TPA: amidohydrolase family protein, partial [Bryobacteraceae bacterium]|nr:amidohydrolase family protein [Bryobacteraceae bacterium]